MRSNKAFTLIELLVVVGVLALLTSILLPALSKARSSAQAVACAGNLRQLGSALQLYGAANNQEVLPIQARWNFNTGRPTRLWTVLGDGEYLDPGGEVLSPFEFKKDPPTVFACGADERALEFKVIKREPKGFSYLANYAVVALASDRPARFPQFRRPSERMMFTEKAGDAVWEGAAKKFPGQFEERVFARHRGDAYANVLYLDGHVDALDRATLVDPADPTGIWGDAP